MISMSVKLRKYWFDKAFRADRKIKQPFILSEKCPGQFVPGIAVGFYEADSQLIAGIQACQMLAYGSLNVAGRSGGGVISGQISGSFLVDDVEDCLIAGINGGGVCEIAQSICLCVAELIVEHGICSI